MIREINSTVSQWSCNRYFVCFQGEEILLKATNDRDAIKEGAELIEELSIE